MSNRNNGCISNVFLILGLVALVLTATYRIVFYASYLNIESTEVIFDWTGGEQDVLVSTDANSWIVENGEYVGWATFQKRGNYLHIHVEQNNSDENRNDHITIRSGYIGGVGSTRAGLGNKWEWLEILQKGKQFDYNGDLVINVKGVSFVMKPVKGGSFQMGGNDNDAYNWERPLHNVTLKSYFIGETEVTQALWKAVMGNNPSDSKGDNNPVTGVSWYDCQVFINKLNEITGKSFRLPTEAEWEFAARGGNKTKGYKYAGSSNIDKVAVYEKNCGKYYGVKSRQANELGLFDMSGNVWEWCQDWYGKYDSGSISNPTGPSSGTLRVLRGGGHSPSKVCRVSYRSDMSPGNWGNNVGFRLALF